MAPPISRTRIEPVRDHSATTSAAPETRPERKKPSRFSPSGMLQGIKRMANGMVGHSPPPPRKSVPLRSSTARPSPKAEDPVSETVAWIRQQNGTATARKSGVRKLTAEQARREGKPVPNRAPPPPPNAGNASQIGQPAHAVPEDEDDLMELDTQTGKVAQPRKTTPLEPPHDKTPLASLGLHYEGLWHDLRRAINEATRSGNSLRETPSKQLKAKRAELQAHADALKHLIAETGMAEADAKMVTHLKTSGELPPHLTVPLDRDIAETIRQRGAAKRMLTALEKAISRLPA
jgi:hypothetical protein